jgi:two-component system, cell cycle response regulator
MTARVLVVDDILANTRLLEARLTAEYFEVLTALNGREALDVLARERVDVVLLDVMMPGMDGYEVCRRIKQDSKLQHIPVVMVTALDQTSDRIQGLSAGADDFLTKPVDDVALVTRVKNLARLKVLNDEMISRAATSQQMGINTAGLIQWAEAGAGGRIMIVDDMPRSAQRIADAIQAAHDTLIVTDPQDALAKLSERDFDCVIVSLAMVQSDGLRLCSQIRQSERTRHLPVVIVIEPGDDARLLRGLDMGVNDYFVRPLDKNEILARVRTQVARKRHTDVLRTSIEQSVEAAITDGLTGLYNRRYMESHLKTLVTASLATGRPLSILVADIDFFKRINDSYGHDAGDVVLREFAARFRRNTRGIDLACRMGGEEFVIIMPDTDLDRGCQVAERLRACVAQDLFQVNSQQQMRITASVGVATLQSANDTPETLFKRADEALYIAKRSGRNRVVTKAA